MACGNDGRALRAMRALLAAGACSWLGAAAASGEPVVVIEQSRVPVGATFTARVEGAPPGARILWQAGSNTGLHRIDSLKRQATFKALSEGEAEVTAVVGGRNLHGRVTVGASGSGGIQATNQIGMPVAGVAGGLGAGMTTGPGISPAKTYEEFAEQACQRFLKTGAVSERDLLYLMSRPAEFNRLIQPWRARGAGAAELVDKVLGIRRVLLRRALSAIRKTGEAAQTFAVMAMGSWATELNAGDMDAIVHGGPGAAQEFNAALDREIVRIIGQEGDDVFSAAVREGATITVERLEVFVSTLGDFGYRQFGQAFQKAISMGDEAGAQHLRQAGKEIIERNLAAQQRAVLNPEVYAGQSGFNFAQDYARKNFTAWVTRPGSLPVQENTTAQQLVDRMLAELGLIAEPGTPGIFNFARVATEYSEWMSRAGRGAREQAKGIRRTLAALRPEDVAAILGEEAHNRIARLASVLATCKREEIEHVRGILEMLSVTEAEFSEAGERLLWEALKRSNQEALAQIRMNLAQAKAARDAGRAVEGEYRRIMDYLMSHEQLAGYSKLSGEQLMRLAKELPPGLEMREECEALLEFMALGARREADQAAELAIRLIRIAQHQGRISKEAAEQASGLAKDLKPLPQEVQDVVSGLRRDLAELAGIRAMAPEGTTLEQCLELMKQYRRNAPSLVAGAEVEEVIAWLNRASETELLRMGFRESEIAVLRQVARARANGLKPGALGNAAKKGSPTRWGATLLYVGVGGGISVYQMIQAANDPSSPDGAFEEALYGSFPTVGLVVEGLPGAAAELLEGGEQFQAQKLGGDVALAVMEGVGLAFPEVGAVVLVVYVGGVVTMSVAENAEERAFIDALFNAMDENGDLNTTGGKRSFLTLPPPRIEREPGTARVRIAHTEAFSAMYGSEAAVKLVVGEGRRPYDGVLRESVRAYAERHFWAGNKKLETWATAIRRYFPDLDLNQVESWRFAEVSEQALTVSGKPFRVGAHMVRRYIHERDLLTEAAIQQIFGRVMSMKQLISHGDEWRKQLEEVERGLGMEGKIVPTAHGEVNDFIGSMWKTAFTSDTRLEQVAGIWKRYLKTYGEALKFLQGRVASVFGDAGLDVPPGDVFFGLSGTESEDAPKIQKVYEGFQEAFLSSAKDFKAAKGGAPDPKDTFDADAWGRLLSVSLRLLSPGTEVRGEKLKAEREEILKEIREHYAQAGISIVVKGPDPAQPKVGDTVCFSAEIQQPKGVETPVDVVWLAEDGMSELFRGASIGWPATKDGAVKWVVAAMTRPQAPALPERLAEKPIAFSVGSKDMPGKEPGDGGNEKLPPGAVEVTLEAKSPVKAGETSYVKAEWPQQVFLGDCRTAWSHGEGTPYSASIKTVEGGVLNVKVEYFRKKDGKETLAGRGTTKVIVLGKPVIKAPKEVLYSEIFEAGVTPDPGIAPQVKYYYWYPWSSGMIVGETVPNKPYATTVPTVKLQYVPTERMARVGADGKPELKPVEMNVSVADAEGKELDQARHPIVVRPVRFSATAGGNWKVSQSDKGIWFERQPAVRKRNDQGKMIDSATALGNIAVTWVSSFVPENEAALRKNVDEAAIWRSLPPAGASEGKIEVVPFSLGDFKGYIKRSTAVVTRYNGNSWGYVDVCLPQANTAGWAQLMKGRACLTISYSTGGGGMGLGEGKLWWDDMPFLKEHAAAADAEVKAIIESLRLTADENIKVVPYTGPALDGSEAAEALAVALKASTTEPKFGQLVDVTAEVKGGKAPYEYTWSGDHAGQGGKVTFASRKAGEHKLLVTVKDAGGGTASGEVTIKVAAVSVQIAGLPGQASYGQSAGISAPLSGEAARIAAGPKPVAGEITDLDGESIGTPKGIKWIWHSDRNLTFDPVEGDNERTTVLFDRMGEAKVWAEIHATIHGVEQTIGEAPQQAVTIIAPAFTVLFDPPAGAKTGQEVKAVVTAEPEVADKLIHYVWAEPPSNNRMERTDNASAIVFRIKDPQPVQLKAMAKVPTWGDEIGPVAATYAGTAYAVKVGVEEFETTKPKIWDPVRGEVVALPRGTYAGDELIRLRAEIEGEPKPEDVRWKWTVNEGTSISNDISQTPTVSRHETGSINAQVEARDKEGVLLGIGQINLQVSVPPDRANPVVVTAKAEKPSIKSGERTRVRAEAKGGTPPYRYTWSGGATGAGESIEVKGEKAGEMATTVNAIDSKGKTGATGVTVTVEAVPLEVTLSMDKEALRVGDTVALVASAKGGTEPYAFQWQGGVQGEGAKGVFFAREAAAVKLTVDVTDKFGNKGSAMLPLQVTAPEARIEGIRPTEFAGTTRAVSVMTDASAPHESVFYCDGAMQVAPAASADGRGSAVFLKPGAAKVWAEVVRKESGGAVTLAKTPEYAVHVEALKCGVRFDPAAGEVGRPVTARVVTASPEVDATGWEITWKSPEDAKGARDGTMVFTPGDSRPVEAAAQVKPKSGGEVIAEASGRYEAKPLEIDVIVGGGRKAVNAAVAVEARLPAGAKLRDVVWEWSVQGGAVRSGGGGAKAEVVATAVGTCGIAVVAKSKAGGEIGRGKAQFEASAGTEGGAGPGAVEPMPQAGASDLDTKAQQLVNDGYALEQTGRLAEALDKYKAAQALVANEGLAIRIAEIEAKLRSGPAPSGTNAVQAGAAPVRVPAEIVRPLHTTGNSGGVRNGPTVPTIFTTAEPYVVASIQTYHWNDGLGKAPGTIGLRHADGALYGPWRASGVDGQGGVKNGYWICEPGAILKPGTYTVIDSDPSTWAQNAQAGGHGFVEVRGAPLRLVAESRGGPGPSAETVAGTDPAATAGGTNGSAAGDMASGNSTSASGVPKPIEARAENGGAQNVHIFVEGQEAFGAQNRIAPGGSRMFGVRLPASGRVTFVAGRNGSILARKTWDGDPEHPERYPVVRFADPDRLTVVTGLR